MFSDRLRSVRTFRGVTQQKTADFLGINIRHYQKYESGEVEPDIKRLAEIADFFNVPSDWLLCRDDYLTSLGVSVDVPRTSPPKRPKCQKNRQSHQTQSSDSGEC